MFKQLFILCALTCCVHSLSLTVGQIPDDGSHVKKVFETQVKADGTPLIKRDEQIFFNNHYGDGDKKIKGIAIKDLENGLVEPSIERGGLGFEYVVIKLNSKLGSGYKFLIEIYA